jgi:hypothetical protein
MLGTQACATIPYLGIVFILPYISYTGGIQCNIYMGAYYTVLIRFTPFLAQFQQALFKIHSPDYPLAYFPPTGAQPKTCLHFRNVGSFSGAGV